MQTPAPFAYARAESVEHALALLQEVPDSRILAGGHSLLPMMKLRLARPERLIDIGDVFELDYVLSTGDEFRIGAMTRHASLLADDDLTAVFPIVADVERVIADPTVRNRGTIGGSLCQADPAEDLSTVCLVLDATVVIRGPRGERQVPIREFARGPYETVVDDGELVTEVRLPVRPGIGSAYHKVERRVGDWAIAAAGVQVQLDGATIADVRIGLTAVGVHGVPRAEEALRGRPATDETFELARGIAGADCKPVTDQRGAEDYKRHLAGELTVRALRDAAARAAGQPPLDAPLSAPTLYGPGSTR
jgi:aerobic carbon-monoxide dehydrogenase medium subunit